MKKDVSPVTINILDKEYVISCTPEEEKDLLSAAQLLNQKVKEIRQAGKVIGGERIAVMAALNLANEVLHNRHGNDDLNTLMSSRIQALQNKVETALGNYRQMELAN